MASNLKYSNGTRDAQQQGLITYAGSGAIIRIYDGTQPSNANTAISGVTTSSLFVAVNTASGNSNTVGISVYGDVVSF